MKNYLLLIILSCTVLFTVFLFIINAHQYPKDSTGTEVDENRLYALGKDLNDHLAGVQIPDFSCTDRTGSNLMLSDLVNEEKVLVLYYSEFHCSSCYEKQFELLQDNFSDSTKILVLGSYQSYRKFKLYLNRRQYTLPIYCIDHGSINWDIDKYQFPYYFVLDKGLIPSYFYIPDQTDIEKNKQYFRYVKGILQ